MNTAEEITFNFYGLGVKVVSELQDLLHDVRRDFSFFLKDVPQVASTLRIIADPGPRDRLPRLKAALQTPRNIVYRQGDDSYVDYFGRALLIYHATKRAYVVYCPDRDLAHEIAFLTILSQVGEHLDAIGLHRVHALGMEIHGRAVLVLLPMGGGKTTLALRLLGQAGAHLLSEDSPLISSDGMVHPFPLRIGVRIGDLPGDVPERYTRTIRRMEFGPKTLIDIEHFRDRLAGACPPGVILLGERWLAGPSEVCPAPRALAVKALVKNAVVGLGLYQGIEFLLERSSWEVLGKAGVALSRLRNCLALIRRSRVWRFAMGPDVEQTAQTLVDFIRDGNDW